MLTCPQVQAMPATSDIASCEIKNCYCLGVHGNLRLVTWDWWKIIHYTVCAVCCCHLRRLRKERCVLTLCPNRHFQVVEEREKYLPL
jgi:hypothetical protein